MTDSQQQSSSMDDIAALAAAKFGGVEYQNDNTPNMEREEEDAPAVSSQSVENQTEQVASSAETEVNDASVENHSVAQEQEETSSEVSQAELDPMLKALLDANQPKAEEVAETQQAQTQEIQQDQASAQQTQAKVLQPNDVIDDATRQMLVEFRDLDEQSFLVMDQVAAAHAKSNMLNLENAVVTVVNQLQNQIAQQNQIIAELRNQISGVHTQVTAPTLSQDIEAMKADPAVAAYLPYMQNVLNGNDTNAKMQLVNTWKSSKSQANATAAPVQTPVVERRTTAVSAAAQATAALTNKTQGSMVQPIDSVEEGMRLAAERFGPNRK